MSIPVRAGQPAAALEADATPVYVDLDGTLILTDLLWESLLSALRRNPLAALRALLQLRHGRAAMKQALARLAVLEPGALPYNEPLLGWLRESARGGRPIYLATAADGELARRVAQHVGVFAGVLASDGRDNLKGPRKLDAIRRHRGEGAFDYCGNGPEDVVIFEAAREAIVVNAATSVRAAAQQRARVTRRFDGPPSGARAWLKALRLHQWLKNLLVFVPLVTSFRIGDPASLGLALGAFVAFCAVASAGYLVNDLLDLASDRHHPTKRHRPLASGRVGVPAAVGAAALGFAGGGALALAFSPALAAWLAAYAVLTLAYSLAIKRVPVFDLIALAALYTIRVLAGGAAVDVEVSFWLLAFSAFLFFSLATIKRCAELVSMRARNEATARGRGYQASDLEVLKSLGTATSVGAVLVLALYVQAPDVAQRYGSPRLLWLMLTGLLAWLAQLWLVTWRGRMHDDPLVFALRDPVSRWLVLAMVAAFSGAAMLGAR